MSRGPLRILAFAVLLSMLLASAGCRLGGGSTTGPVPSGEPPDSEDQSGPPAAGGERVQESDLPGALLVMVENHPDARPQAGLDQADLVYEIEAEGGITRFLAVFYHHHAPRVGPVRSARVYFVQIAKAYDAPYAHAGGSNDALKLIRQIGIKDLDEIYNAGPFFWRIRERKMPHNLYTSTESLLTGAQARNFSLAPPPSLPLGEAAGGSPAAELSLTYAKLPAYTYATTYKYENGQYSKYINGRPHVMENGTPIEAANVVVLFADTRPVKKEDWQLDIKIVGQGEALFFTGGEVFRGEWRKDGADSHFEFLHQDRPMAFAPGTTWVNVVPDAGYIEY